MDEDRDIKIPTIEADLPLLDFFAGCALAGLSNSYQSYKWRDRKIAEECYRRADAMLAARKEKSDGT